MYNILYCIRAYSKLKFTSTKSDYYLSVVEIEFPESLLPNSNSSDIVKISEKVEKFRTKIDHAYSCRSDAEIKMVEFGQGLQGELSKFPIMDDIR